jgi:hypothetical protein
VTCFRCGGRGHKSINRGTPSKAKSPDGKGSPIDKKVKWQVNALRELLTDEGYEVDDVDDDEEMEGQREGRVGEKRRRDA